MGNSFLKIFVHFVGALILVLWMVATPLVHAQSMKPLQVCATVPDLGNLAQEIGGDQVKITVFAKAQEDSHFVEAKPSFIKALSQADLFLQIGMELEIGWAPVLVRNARNGRVLPGEPGFIDASKVIRPLEVPTGPVDRSMGDVHPGGNPHYLLDPLNGLRVGRLIKDKLSGFRPEKKAFFDEQYLVFNKKMGKALLGERLASKYEIEKLALLYEEGKLESFLKEQKEVGPFGGWLEMTSPYFGSKVVADHNMWPYFGRRFGVSVVGFLEPIPGLSPTTKHLQAVVDMMRVQRIKVILSSPYFDPRHAQFVAKNTAAKIANLAHQVGARPGTGDYLSMIDYNVRQIVAASEGRP